MWILYKNITVNIASFKGEYHRLMDQARARARAKARARVRVTARTWARARARRRSRGRAGRRGAWS